MEIEHATISRSTELYNNNKVNCLMYLPILGQWSIIIVYQKVVENQQQAQQNQGNGIPKYLRVSVCNVPIIQDLIKQTSVLFVLVLVKYQVSYRLRHLLHADFQSILKIVC